MRTIDPAINAAELSGNLNPTESLIASYELLSFAAFTTQVNASLDTGAPQSFAMRAAGAIAYAAYRYTNGTSRLQVMTPATAAQWALSGGAQVNASTVLCMRNGVFTDASGSTWLYIAAASGSAIQVQRQQIDSITTDPPAVSLSNYGITFGGPLADTATLVRRVEAVCPTDGGVIVCVGTHDFTNDLSTLKFYWLPDASTAILLDTIIQMPLTEAYTNWYSAAKYATYVCAIYDATNKAVRVVANAHPNGKAVEFSITGGVESMIAPVVPVEPLYGSGYFRASSVSKIGTLYYLCGRLTFSYSDGTSDAYDCYLTSSDATNWSLGERSFYLTSADCAGSLLADKAANPVLIYYGGNLIAKSATATPAQGYNTGLQVDLTDRLQPDWRLGQVSNGPHKLNGTLENHDSALTASAIVKGGATLYFRCGQWGVTSPIGVYNLDNPAAGVTGMGRTPAKFAARDAANKAIVRHNALVSMDLWGRDVLESTLSTMSGLVVKTATKDVLALDPSLPIAPDLADYDVILSAANGLQSKALNNPLFAYADVADAPDMMLAATVTMPDTGAACALRSVAFLLDVADDGTGTAIIIPSASSWNAGKTKPRLAKLNLRPVDATLNTGGFNFDKRYQGLWYSINAGSDAYLQALSELPSHYVSEPGFTHAAGAIRDYKVRRSGGRVQLYSKVHDYSVATCSTNAIYTLISEYLFSDDAALAPFARCRPGLAVNTDAWALKTAFDHAAYGDQEIGLSSAADYHTFAGTRSGTAQCDHTGGADHLVNLGAGIGTSNFYVGQWVKTVSGGDVHTWQVDSLSGGFVWAAAGVTITNASSGTTIDVYIVEQDAYFGEAKSQPVYKTVTGGTVFVDPRPIKASKTLTGKAAFVGNDPSNSLYAPRWVDSDGVTHLLLSGSPLPPTGLNAAWDATSPKVNSDLWKMILHHNAIFKGRASTLYGLPAAERMIVEQEIVRYGEESYTGHAEIFGTPTTRPTAWITAIPTYYATPAPQTTPSMTILNKWVGGARPGDELSAIPNPAGMLIEITGRSSGGAAGDVPNVYATGVTGGGTSANPGGVTIDTLPAGPILDTDFLIVSGRGQLGTKKAAHASDAAVCYYPAPISATAAVASFVTVSRFDAYTGRYKSVEDWLTYLCALAGVRTVTFRNLMTGAYATAPWTGAITAMPANLPLVDTLADFVLDLQAHLDASAKLLIDFRGYYRLSIYQPSAGAVIVGIQAPSSGLTADGNGLKWLECTPAITISPVNLCAAAADNVSLRVTAVGNLVGVEINGKPVWTFNLAQYMHTDGTSYQVLTQGVIALSYSLPVAGNSASARVPELWDELQHISMAQGENTSATIKRLCDKYHVWSRPTVDGGLHFARFVVRDDAGTLTKAIDDHTHESDDAQPVGHVQVSGAQTGGHVNETFILKDGYSFTALSNGDLETVQQARDVAQAKSRESVEYSQDEVVNALARLGPEVEDKVQLMYTPGGDAPAQAAIDCVINALDWTRSKDKIVATYKLRGFQAWQ